jgi:hypothetical protein
MEGVATRSSPACSADAATVMKALRRGDAARPSELRHGIVLRRHAGRMAVSDVVARAEVPAHVRHHVELWSGCIAGALEESDYRAKLKAAGFEAIEIEPTKIYSAAQCS